MTGCDCDYLVVGSGFGGAVSVLRLSRTGYRVIVLEQGRRIGPRSDRGRPGRLSESVWQPELLVNAITARQPAGITPRLSDKRGSR
jgi:choline dehydrogenase-like flavoprotein